MKRIKLEILTLLIAIGNLSYSMYRFEGSSVYSGHNRVVNTSIDGEIPADIESFEVIDEFFAKDKNTVYFRDSSIFKVDIKSFIPIARGISRDKDKVYKFQYELEGIDTDTVKVFKNKKNEILNVYLKDKNGIYFSTISMGVPILIKIEKADYESFIELHSGYAQDKKNIYYKGEKIKANPKTFMIIEDKRDINHYSKDKDNVFYDGNEINKADIKTFNVLNYIYSKDKNNIYYLNNKLKEADVRTFEVLNDQYSKDKNNVYYYDGEIIENRDAKTFNLLDESYSKDRNGIYYLGKKLENINMETFKILNYGYSKDKDSIFYHGIPLTTTDTETFEVLNSNYARDKNNIYYKDKRIGNIDARKVKVLNSVYLKDKSRVYYLDKNILNKNFDVNYFEKDKNQIYLRELENADAETFEVLNSVYSKDKNTIYCGTIPIKEMDVKTFELTGENSSKDKNNKYHFCKKIKN